MSIMYSQLILAVMYVCLCIRKLLVYALAIATYIHIYCTYVYVDKCCLAFNKYSYIYVCLNICWTAFFWQLNIKRSNNNTSNYDETSIQIKVCGTFKDQHLFILLKYGKTYTIGLKLKQNWTGLSHQKK